MRLVFSAGEAQKPLLRRLFGCAERKDPSTPKMKVGDCASGECKQACASIIKVAFETGA